MKYNKEELAKLAKKNSGHFTKLRNWNEFSRENGLPSGDTYRRIFGSWNDAKRDIFGHSNYISGSREKLIEVAIENRKYFTSKAKWDKFSKENGLPSSAKYRYLFGTWNNAKMTIFEDFEPSNVSYSREYLLNIAKEYIEFFTTQRIWKKISKENNLPSDQVYSSFFGSWNAAKKELGLNTSKSIKKTEYTKEELIKIAHNNKRYFTFTTTWDEYASKNSLPKSNIFIYRFGGTWHNTKKELGLSRELSNFNISAYTMKELVSVAKNYRESFTTIEEWDNLAKEKNLPRSATYMIRFECWNDAKKKIFGNYKLNKIELIEIALQHKNYFTTINSWTERAREYNLPSYGSYIKKFGSWKKACQQILGCYENNRKLTKEKLIEIALEHKEHFTSMSCWTEHAREYNLPSYGSYVKMFGSWKKACQQILGYYVDSRKLSKKELIEIALEHKEYFTSMKSWTEHARKYNLPFHGTYINMFGTWKKACKEILGNYENNKKLTKEKLIEIALEHKEHFTSMRCWTEHARKYNLPSYSRYVKMFGSWKKACQQILGYYVDSRKLSKKELIEIALEHNEYFTSMKSWTEHARKYNLPSHGMYLAIKKCTKWQLNMHATCHFKLLMQ